MDGTWEPGAGAKDPSGVGGVEGRGGFGGNGRGPRWPRACGVREASPPITGDPREVAGGHQGGGGGRCTALRGGARQATARADGLDKVRALQRVLYRSAKQQPQRRFHALFDKVARGDILCRAWDEVRSNRGAPGVDGVTIDQVEASGVAAFLGELAAALRTGSYRPAPLRRGPTPHTGPPGENP